MKGNVNNLELNSERTPEKRKEIARKGGLASGEKRKERKRMKEWAEIIGQKTTTITNADGSTEEVPYDAALITSMYYKAIEENDVRAAEFIAKLKGEMEDKVTLGGQVQGVNVVVSSPDTEKKLNKILKK